MQEWVWSLGEMILTGRSRSTWRNTCPTVVELTRTATAGKWAQSGLISQDVQKVGHERGHPGSTPDLHLQGPGFRSRPYEWIFCRFSPFSHIAIRISRQYLKLLDSTSPIHYSKSSSHATTKTVGIINTVVRYSANKQVMQLYNL